MERPVWPLKDKGRIVSAITNQKKLRPTSGITTSDGIPVRSHAGLTSSDAGHSFNIRADKTISRINDSSKFNP